MTAKKKGKPSEWEIKATKKEGKVSRVITKKVQGARMIDFGIRRELGIKGWRIDHIPSGRSIFAGNQYVSSLGRAKELVLKLYGYGSWESPNMKDYSTPEKKEAYAVIKQYAEQ